jgi:hypothetical protein
MKTFQDLLKELNACSEAQVWAGDKTIEQVVSECHRGDWLLWLAARVDADNRKLVLTAGKCAETVIHLMKDKRSKAAVKAAIEYGEGRINEDELNAAAYAAATAATAAAYADAAAAYAAYAADYAAGAVADAATAYAYAAATAADAAAGAAGAVRAENRMLTAKIVREILGSEIIEKVFNKLLSVQNN